MVKSLRPYQIASIGCGILANECNARASRAGNLDDMKAEIDRGADWAAKGMGLLDGSVAYMPILDRDLQTAYDAAIKRIKG